MSFELNRYCRRAQAPVRKPSWQAGRVRAGILFLFLFLSGLFAYSQKADTITKFKVKYITGDYRFFPADGYLFAGNKNKLQITNSRNARFEVKLTNGSAQKI